jgi:hypothetical protein
MVNYESDSMLQLLQLPKNEVKDLLLYVLFMIIFLFWNNLLFPDMVSQLRVFMPSTDTPDNAYMHINVRIHMCAVNLKMLHYVASNTK